MNWTASKHSNGFAMVTAESVSTEPASRAQLDALHSDWLPGTPSRSCASASGVLWPRRMCYLVSWLRYRAGCCCCLSQLRALCQPGSDDDVGHAGCGYGGDVA